jgi:hypothetical protein
VIPGLPPISGRRPGCPTVNRVSLNKARSDELEHYQHFTPINGSSSISGAPRCLRKLLMRLQILRDLNLESSESHKRK